MIIFYSIVLFILGSCIGSFLNVVILRTHEKKTLGGRSQCPYCKHELQTLDLVPVISYLVLQGKCRYCSHKLSIQYPLVELLTAVSFTLVFLAFNSDFVSSIWYLVSGIQNTKYEILNILFAFFVTSVFMVVSVYDLRWGLIPDKIILPASITALTYQILLFVLNTRYEILNTALLGLGLTLLTAFCVGLFFLLLIVVTKGKGMGGGDLKLSVFIALALGFPLTLIALLLAFLTGALASVILLLSGKKGLKSKIPFGPFLALGAVLSMILGPNLWRAYLQMLGFN